MAVIVTASPDLRLKALLIDLGLLWIVRPSLHSRAWQRHRCSRAGSRYRSPARYPPSAAPMCWPRASALMRAVLLTDAAAESGVAVQRRCRGRSTDCSCCVHCAASGWLTAVLERFDLLIIHRFAPLRALRHGLAPSCGVRAPSAASQERYVTLRSLDRASGWSAALLEPGVPVRRAVPMRHVQLTSGQRSTRRLVFGPLRRRRISCIAAGSESSCRSGPLRPVRVSRPRGIRRLVPPLPRCGQVLDDLSTLALEREDRRSEGLRQIP